MKKKYYDYFNELEVKKNNERDIEKLDDGFYGNRIYSERIENSYSYFIYPKYSFLIKKNDERYEFVINKDGDEEEKYKIMFNKSENGKYAFMIDENKKERIMFNCEDDFIQEIEKVIQEMYLRGRNDDDERIKESWRNYRYENESEMFNIFLHKVWQYHVEVLENIKKFLFNEKEELFKIYTEAEKEIFEIYDEIYDETYDEINKIMKREDFYRKIYKLRYFEKKGKFYLYKKHPSFFSINKKYFFKTLRDRFIQKTFEFCEQENLYFVDNEEYYWDLLGDDYEYCYNPSLYLVDATKFDEYSDRIQRVYFEKSMYKKIAVEFDILFSAIREKRKHEELQKKECERNEFYNNYKK